jgi:hypothetical protein
MILGISHDTCSVCGKDIQMRKDRKLYHHGHPARRCSGAGEFGVRMAKFIADAKQRIAQYDGSSDG